MTTQTPNQTTKVSRQIVEKTDAFAIVERRRIFLNACIASHSKAFDRASHVLDVAQQSPILFSGVAESTAKQMLFHLRELHNLTIDLGALKNH